MGNYLERPIEQPKTSEPLLYFTATHVARIQKKQEELERDVKVLRSQLQFAERKLKKDKSTAFFCNKEEHIQCIQHIVSADSTRRQLIFKTMQYVEEKLFDNVDES